MTKSFKMGEKIYNAAVHIMSVFHLYPTSFQHCYDEWERILTFSSCWWSLWRNSVMLEQVKPWIPDTASRRRWVRLCILYTLKLRQDVIHADKPETTQVSVQHFASIEEPPNTPYHWSTIFQTKQNCVRSCFYINKGVVNKAEIHF